MDRIFDRLADLLRQFFHDSESYSWNYRSHYDPDLDDAWDELNEYLKGSSRVRNTTWENYHYYRRSTESISPREELRQDYANLEVPFGAPFSEVKKAYKKLITKYHPDKHTCLLYTSPSPRDLSTSRMPSSA